MNRSRTGKAYHMKHYTIDNIEKCPIDALKVETLWILKEICKQKIQPEKSLISPAVQGEIDAFHLEKNLKTIDDRITNGFQLIVKRLR